MAKVDGISCCQACRILSMQAAAQFILVGQRTVLRVGHLHNVNDSDSGTIGSGIIQHIGIHPLWTMTLCC